MNVDLKCSDNIKGILTEMLENRKIKITNQSDIVILEKGYDIEDGKIGIVFELSTLNNLIHFLDSFLGQQENRKVITGKYEGNYEVIKYNQISYFEGLGNDVFCIVDNKKFKVKEKLYELEEKLRDHGFIRISKSFIVNIIKIDQIQPWFNGKLLLKMKDTSLNIYVTRRYLKEFKTFLGL
ncbi:MAG: LytTR family transcriptional regulator [Tepidibacter sp.]|jgi:DNA-binding LytR/AlgR family response regulator|uniref:LytTR family DNA-binding domain-containing protein n=1 Tax=Tepidibacter sp. TaxID=2529387 RepID=UPI0025D4973F|nr:LytTR family DNA-binding domain-containing protein [Tepidibacter sp.]MCT4507394.1 LytTR family transcriptional regulator [Tepidibacter sp.]